MSKWMLVTGLAVLGASPSHAQATLKSIVAAPRPVHGAVVSDGRLSFDGRANVGNFTGVTTTLQGELVGGDDLSQVRGWVEAPVSTLVTGNGKRDRDLNRSMESDKYPTIRFDLAGVVPSDSGGDTVQVDLQGAFQIHGVRRDVTIPATAVFAGDAIRVRAATPLNLKDYGIGGLSKAFGMLRMYQDIVVHIDVTFAPTPGASDRPKA
jgi:polyisoprenoid-binding protein YceI